MDSLFLDANILFAAAYKYSSPLRRLWELGDVELWTCDYAIAEATRNLSRSRPERLAELKRLIGLMKQSVEPARESDIPADVSLVAKDRPILLAAIAVGASHLLTGDKAHFSRHFGQRIGGVLILPPSDYLRNR